MNQSQKVNQTITEASVKLTNDLQFLSPFFLGAYAENNDVLESLLVEFVRDHIYWRRNFHPEDTPPITPAMTNQTEYKASLAKVRLELHKLTAKLKRSVPFFNPRYIGHMSSDLMLPGLLAQLITVFYNPNNITDESGEVTLKMELEVGEQFARMFGFNTNKDSYPCAWGHLTSGGTSANYESLWNFRAAKYYPVAMVNAINTMQLCVDLVEQNKPENYTPWQLINFSIDQVLNFRRAVFSAVEEKYGKDTLLQFICLLEKNRIEALGPSQFFAENIHIKQPVVIVPATAHYSWERAMRVLGFGSASLIKVPLTQAMRMDEKELGRLLDNLHSQNIPVLAVIGVLGTTEFGTIDPIHKIISIRQKYIDKGLNYYIHIDAAWGGYLTTIFRSPTGEITPRKDIRNKFSHFPSTRVYDSFNALKATDSITIDPHKLGYLPFGTGGFVARNKEIVKLLTVSADYVFENNDEPDFRQVGQYILEGSKPGANAAAAYVAHAVLPLDNENFGRIIRQTIRSAEYFYEQLNHLKNQLDGKIHLIVPIEPDSNLITIAVNPYGNDSLKVMNDFTHNIYKTLSHDPQSPVQSKEFLGSKTTLALSNLTPNEQVKLFKQLGLAVNTIEDHRKDKVIILRHTLMNPWLSAESEGHNYLDKYCQFLNQILLNLAKTTLVENAD
jgi:glutamate/tyrosine decarboxylase-like PLP-dependent enzyme